MSGVRGSARVALAVVLTGLTASTFAGAEGVLPPRVERIVLHVLGGPSYHEGERRFVFYEPARTQRLWKATFGAHWIVWTDGTLWPRHVPPGTSPWWTPDATRPADLETRARLAREARPVYSHLYRGNSSSVGIELAHSGRRDEPFPPAQARATAWLVRSLLEMSAGRLDARSVFGHKDLDQRPAYVQGRCERPGCLMFVDAEGRPYRRRVDPPEALFDALAREGLEIPRPAGGDSELIRAESLGATARPSTSR
jgi:N-acetylmuramoyl-L-alanine amidase